MQLPLAKSQRTLTLCVCMLNVGLLMGARLANAENVVSTTTGPSGNRVDVVFVGDGYQEHELDLYHLHLDGAINHIFTGTEEPFNRYQNFFNFHRVEVISEESGADVPPENVFVDTALGASYYWDGFTERLMSVNTVKADAIVNRSISRSIDIDMRLAAVNSTRYGGAGGTYATFAGGNSAAFEIALHELGHSFSNLADEYVSFESPYVGGEPTEANVTIDGTGAKWEQWLGYEQDGLGTIGVYEGGRYYASGIYRPSLNSKMRALGIPFDAVSRERMVLDIYQHVTPIDYHASNSATLGFADEPWVQLVDADILDLTWSVDGMPLAETDSSVFILEQFRQLDLQPGSYELSVEAVDNTDWIRLEDSRPRQHVSWTVDYYPGDFSGDMQIDAIDMDLLTDIVLAETHVQDFDLTRDGLVDQADREIWLAVNHVLPGDADLDSKVDFSDFLVLSGNFGRDTNSWSDGNFDGEAGVMFADFLLLSANFGAVSSAAATVPEPSAMSLLGLALAAWLLPRRSRPNR